MIKRLAFALGRWWLSGPKYMLSRLLAGRAWEMPFDEVIPKRYPLGEDFPENKLRKALDEATTPEAVVAAFRGLWRWRPDPVLQLWDRVYPPALLLARGGDDCDGWAMLHAQAIEFALGRHGWRSAVVTYLADPWWLSHHFTAAIAPGGEVYAIQPQPSAEQAADLRIVFGPFDSVQSALRAVSDSYRVAVVWYDVRRPDFSVMK